MSKALWELWQEMIHSCLCYGKMLSTIPFDILCKTFYIICIMLVKVFLKCIIHSFEWTQDILRTLWNCFNSDILKQSAGGPLAPTWFYWNIVRWKQSLNGAAKCHLKLEVEFKVNINNNIPVKWSFIAVLERIHQSDLNRNKKHWSCTCVGKTKNTHRYR